MKTILPFTPPFRVISDFRFDSDAHIVDATGNSIIETAGRDRHKESLELITETLNERFHNGKSERQRLIAKLRELMESDDIIEAAKPEVAAFLKEFEP